MGQRYSLLSTENDVASLWLRQCTVELRAAIGDRIRFVFYPMRNTTDDKDHDYDYVMSIEKSPCLKMWNVGCTERRRSLITPFLFRVVQQ